MTAGTMGLGRSKEPDRLRLCDDCAATGPIQLGRWNSIKPVKCYNCLGLFGTGVVVQMPAPKRKK